MGIIGDITREVVSKSIRFDLTPEQTVDFLEGVLEAAGYDTFEQDLWELMGTTTNHFITQTDGLYDVTHRDIKDWVKRHGG